MSPYGFASSEAMKPAFRYETVLPVNQALVQATIATMALLRDLINGLANMRGTTEECQRAAFVPRLVHCLPTRSLFTEYLGGTHE